ncbi:cellulose binding domain-containing protein, partial [Micromonospora sp. DH15]|nr:cellulose binding domain-containing protein [Micromonospora sp. DH15]
NPSVVSPSISVRTLPGTDPTPTPTPTTPAGACKVAYTTSDWSTGFSANITITNTGATALNGWSLAFTFGNAGQKVTQGWSANFTQTGTAVTASNAAYNAALAPGASTTLGFNGTHTGANPKPTAFTLNGSACTLG